MSIDLFPAPRKARYRQQSFDLSDARWVTVDPSVSASLKRHVVAFADSLSDAFASPLEATAGKPAAGGVLLNIVLERRGPHPQGYRLTSGPDGITLSACGEAGLFYGLETLRQLIAQTGARVPAFTIDDEPDFPRRGIMLDISRCKVPTMESLLDLVDLMVRLKLNELQLYTEHTFAFSEHEAVWHDASPITAEEVLLLDAYCRDRFIDLVPNLNSFGHFERWLRHPEYRKHAECPDGFEYSWGGRSEFGSTLKPNRASLRLLSSLYDEFLPNFTSAFMNVGCDETWELGKGWSKKLCKEKGSTRVYVDFLLQIHKLAARHGREMQFWGDIILHQPELIDELPDGIIGLVWGYEFDHPFSRQCRRFGKSGVPFYVCPGTSSWRSLIGRTANCMGNLLNAARSGMRHGAIGYLNTDWGDMGHHQYLPISYPGYFAGAALSWCVKKNRDADVAGAIDALAFGDEAGVLGKLLLDIGKVGDLVPKRVYNATIYNQLLFHDIGADYLLRGVTASSLKRSVDRFDRLSAKLGDARPAAADGDLVKAEIANAIAMARLGAERGLAGLDPAQCDRGELRRAMQHVVGRHEDLWLARNRRGGLTESSGHLREQLAKLL